MSGRHNRVKCQSAAILMSAASRIKTWAISRDSGSCQWAASEPWFQQGEHEGGRNWHQIEVRELLQPKLNSMHAWFNKKQKTKEAMYPLWSCICICCWVAPCSISAIIGFSLLLTLLGCQKVSSDLPPHWKGTHVSLVPGPLWMRGKTVPRWMSWPRQKVCSSAAAVLLW